MWVKTIALLLWLFFISTIAYAQTLTPVIGPPLDTPAAGTTMVFPVYYHNSDNHAITINVPEKVACQLKHQGKTNHTIARRIAPEADQPVKVAAQGFFEARFGLSLAPDLKGDVLLVVPQFSSTGIALAIDEASRDQKNEVDRFSWEQRSADQPMDAIIEMYQPYVKNLSFYRPMYFLVGTDPEKSKFQVSFKYRFFNPEKPLAIRYPWVQGFHLGYTQTSFWDLNSDSAPFEDTSYKPELYFISPRIQSSFTSLDGLFIKTGLQHESNGKGEALSRSTNIAYIEPIFLFYNDEKNSGLKISPKFWFYFANEDENNPDIDEYRGFFNLGITAGHADGLVLDTNFQWGNKGPSVQLDATYPLHTLFFNHLDMYLHLNYTNTLAESLVNYTEREQAVRIGFAIVR